MATAVRPQGSSQPARSIDEDLAEIRGQGAGAPLGTPGIEDDLAAIRAESAAKARRTLAVPPAAEATRVAPPVAPVALPFGRRLVKAAFGMMEGGPMTALQMTAAPAQSAATAARFIGQSAAETTLPADIRARALADPERISEEEAALSGLQLAVPTIPATGLVGRAMVGAGTGLVYSPEDPLVGTVIGGVAGAAAGIPEAIEGKPALGLRLLRRVRPTAEAPVAEPITDPARQLEGRRNIRATATAEPEAPRPQPPVESIEETLAKVRQERGAPAPEAPAPAPVTTPAPEPVPEPVAAAPRRPPGPDTFPEPETGRATRAHQRMTELEEQGRAALKAHDTNPSDATASAFHDIVDQVTAKFGDLEATRFMGRMADEQKASTPAPTSAPTPAAARSEPDVYTEEGDQAHAEKQAAEPKKLRKSLTKASDDEIAKEYRRVVDANQADLATFTGMTESGKFDEMMALRQIGLAENAKGIQLEGGKDLDPDALRAGGLARNRTAQRDKTLAKLEAELTRRGIEHADAYWLGGDEAPTDIPFERSPTYTAGRAKETAPAYDEGKEFPARLYSRLEHAIKRAPFEKGTPAQWRAALEKNVAKSEREATGLDTWLTDHATDKSIERSEVLAQFDKSKVELGQVSSGTGSNRDKLAAEAAMAASRPAAIAALGKVDFLGFDHTGQALSAIETHPDWQTRWDASELTEAEVHDIERYVKARRASREAESRVETRYSSYVEPGGTNYREHVVTLKKPVDIDAEARALSAHPWDELSDAGRAKLRRLAEQGSRAPGRGREEYTSAHWPGIKNPIVHIRTSDRTLPSGEKALFVEEIQSDWHQQGRRKGYNKPMTSPAGWASVDDPRSTSTSPGVPDAPFKKTPEWAELGLKKVIDEAVRGKYDRVVWSTGEQQARRYDLSKQIDELLYDPATGELDALKNGDIVHNGKYDAKALPDVVGKEAADKLLASPLESRSVGDPEADETVMSKEPLHRLAGLELRVGGEGMKAFYDRMLPNVVRDYGKKIGVPLTVEQVPLGHGKPLTPQEVTTHADELRDAGTPPLVVAVLHEVAADMSEVPHPPWRTVIERMQAVGVRGAVAAGNRLQELESAGLETAPSTANPSFKITPELRAAVLEKGQSIAERSPAYVREARQIEGEGAAVDVTPTAAQLELFKQGGDPIASDRVAFGSRSAQRATVARVKKEGGKYVSTVPAHLPSAKKRLGILGQVDRAWIDLRGARITDPKDIHELLAPFRDPQNERMHALLLDKDGRVLSHTMETSGAINYVQVDAVPQRWLQEIVRRAKRLGAVDLVLSHNHPSGDPTASPDDINFTAWIVPWLRKRGVNLIGHYVIDHDSGNWLAAGPESLTKYTLKARPAFLKGHSVDWTQAHGPVINGAAQIHQLVRAGEEHTHLTVAYLSSQLRVVAIEPHDIGKLANADQWIPSRMRALGAGRVAIVVPTSHQHQAIKVMGAKVFGDRVVDIAVPTPNVTALGGAGVVSLRSSYLFEPGDFDESTIKSARRVRERGGDYDEKKPGIGVAPVEGPAAKVNAVADAVRKVFAPASRGAQAAEMANIIRHRGAAMMHELERAREAMRQFAKGFDRMAPADRLAFIYRMEEGKLQPTPELREAARLMRQMLDQGRDEVRALGTGKLEHWIENYFPHIWKEPGAAKTIIGRIIGKRPLQGPRSFLKKRSIPTTREGIEQHKLEPVTDNPVELTLLKLREMKRYVMAQKIFREAQEQHLVEFVRAHAKATEGLERINDGIATVYGPPTVPFKEGFDAGVRSQLLDILEQLGVKHERPANLGGTKLGYASGGKEVVSKFGTESVVIEHELGHILDERYGLWEHLVAPAPKEDHTFTKGKRAGQAVRRGVKQTAAEVKARAKIRDELRALADLRHEDTEATPHYKKYVREQPEQIANAVHAFIYAPERMQQVAPTVKAKLEAFLKSKPELAAILQIRPSLRLSTATTEIPIEGIRILGTYHAPEAVARVLNNYLSPGFRGNAIYDAYQGVNNVLNQAQLGFSAFHLGFTSVDAAVSQVAVGLQNVVAGRVLKGLGQMASSPAAPVTTFLRGRKLLAAYLRPMGASEELLAMVDALVQGGGRVRQDSFYATGAPMAFLEALRHREVGSAAMKALPAIIEAAAIPVMQGVVPRQKLGVFAQLAEHELATLPASATPSQVRDALGRAWDSVDNRLGQLVYDNLFWNRAFKDLAMTSVRSVGWNLGTIRELGGGVKDFATQSRRLLGRTARRLRGTPVVEGPGASVEFTPRMSYVIALPIAVGLAGAILGYLLTGERPKELRDYFFPKTGRKNAEGNDERVQLPSYMKDVVGYLRHPVATVQHKLAPVLGTLGTMLSNEDFYGDEVRNPDAPIVKQLEQTVKYLLHEFVPLAVRNVQESEKRTTDERAKLGGFVGVTVAPRELTRTPAQRKLMEYLAGSAQRGATPEERAQRDELASLKRDVALGRVTEAKLDSLEASGKITTRQRAGLARQADKDPWLARFNGLSVDRALVVFKLGNASERDAWRETVERKLDRAGRSDEIAKLPKP